MIPKGGTEDLSFCSKVLLSGSSTSVVKRHKIQMRSGGPVALGILMNYHSHHPMPWLVLMGSRVQQHLERHFDVPELIV